MYQALVSGLIWPLAGMEMSGSGADHSGELSSSVHVNAFPDPDLTDHFDLTVRRPPSRPIVLRLLWPIVD